MTRSARIPLGWLVTASTATAPFLAWAVFQSITLAEGERSRELASLTVLVYLPRIAVFSLGTTFGTGIVATRQRVRAVGLLDWVMMGVLGAAAVVAWTQLVAPIAEPTIVPAVPEVTAWLLVGVLAGAAVPIGRALLRGATSGAE